MKYVFTALQCTMNPRFTVNPNFAVILLDDHLILMAKIFGHISSQFQLYLLFFWLTVRVPFYFSGVA